MHRRFVRGNDPHRMRFKSIEKRLSASKKLRTTAADSQRMGRIRHIGTAPELAVRRIASGLGLWFRLTNRDLVGSPDLANRSRRWAVFVHGCYWHRHEGCPKSTIPTRNRAFWLAKFRANRLRDRRVIRELERQGFRVVVAWECQATEPEIVVEKLRPFRGKGGAALRISRIRRRPQSTGHPYRRPT